MMNIENLAVSEDNAALASWLAGAQKIVSDHMRENYPSNPPITLKAYFGKRYVKVMREATGEWSVHAFIDRRNGDVLKPATFSAPAKHARGNIFDANNGLGSMGPWGPAYLK